jgi:hypothetical protein
MKSSVFKILLPLLLVQSLSANNDPFEVGYDYDSQKPPSLDELCPRDYLQTFYEALPQAKKTNKHNALFFHEFKRIWCGFGGIMYSSNQNDLSFQERYGGFVSILEEMMQAYHQGLTESNSAMKSKYWTLGNYTVIAQSQNFFSDMRFNRPALTHHIDLFENSVLKMIDYFEFDVLVNEYGQKVLKPMETDLSVRQVVVIQKLLRVLMKMNNGSSSEIKLDSQLVKGLKELDQLADKIINAGNIDTLYTGQNIYKDFIKAYIKIEARINRTKASIEEYVESRTNISNNNKQDTAEKVETEVAQDSSESMDDLLGALDSFNADEAQLKIKKQNTARNSKTYRYLSNLVDSIYDLARMKQLYINEMKNQ